ncbi:MAG: glycine cleavage system H protein [Verrucomicrobiales bacterium]
MFPVPTILQYIRYKHARFSARFPETFRYSRSHYWMSQDADDPQLWRVGFTKFATRMLGELVDAQWKIDVGGAVACGDEIGYVEGFKAASDVFCVMDGDFAGGNPELDIDACIVRSDPYLKGWLYSVKGEPEEENMDVHEYIALLAATIERMQSEEHAAEG